MMETEPTTPTTDGDMLHLAVHGWCTLDNMIPESQVEGVLESVTRTVESSEYLGDRNFLAHNADFVRYVAHGRMLALLQELWGRFYRVAWTTPLILEPGTSRGPIHIDWPFGTVWLPRSAGIKAPFPDTCLALTTVWMLSPRTRDTAGTIVVSGSHRSLVDPFVDPRVDPNIPHATQMHVPWKVGSVLVFDSRLWHTNPEHVGAVPRVTVKVCYAPWWLNLQPLDPTSSEGKRMAEEFGRTAAPPMPRVPAEAYRAMPERVKPLFHHWVSW